MHGDRRVSLRAIAVRILLFRQPRCSLAPAFRLPGRRGHVVQRFESATQRPRHLARNTHVLSGLAKAGQHLPGRSTAIRLDLSR
jgi:hypothetical protein